MESGFSKNDIFQRAAGAAGVAADDPVTEAEQQGLGKVAFMR